MESPFIPKKFDIQFKRISEDQYAGTLIIDGRQMVVGSPKTLDEITAFLLPQMPLAARLACPVSQPVGQN